MGLRESRSGQLVPLAVAARFLSKKWPVQISRAVTNEPYFLYPNCLEYQRPNDAVVIAELCNQSLIYDFLFRRRLEGKRYELDHAKGFLDWSNQGWISSEYLVFLVRDKEEAPVACIDIKQSDLALSEIGYWCSSKVTGIMTQTVARLVDLSAAEGFKSLIGITLHDNLRSQGVLLRNGFSDAGEFEEDGQKKRKFLKELGTSGE